MTPEERQRIISEDYADLIVPYNGDEAVFNAFPNATVQIINFFYAIVYLPVSMVTNKIISERGYGALPLIFAPISQSSLEASGVIRLRNIPNFNLRGKGVLIGIIDTGIDYTNPVFINADNTTKILSIWDQSIQSENLPEKFNYGTEYTREQINQALQNENPFSIVPTTDEVGHGTMVSGIAAGNEAPESGFYGVAPDAELIVVKLKSAKKYLKDFFMVPDSAICYQENDLFFGLEYITAKAIQQNMPLAICIAMGSSLTSHDGRRRLSYYLSHQAEFSGVSLTIAAGNEGNARRHYFGEINATTGFDTVELNIGENESSFSMTLWGTSPGVFSIDIQTPSGEYVPRIVTILNESREVSFIFEPTIIYIDYEMIESESGSQLILLRFQKPSSGIWKFKVYGRGDLSLTFHIWLPMGDFISDNTFFIRSNPYTTILSPGNSRLPITVTAYNDSDDSLYLESSRGYTRTNIVKPDIAAPGVNIVAPTINHEFNNVNGTSAAAAHTVGITAMLLEWGIVNGNFPNMNSVDIKSFLIRGARRNETLRYPNRDWGYGILDIYNVFDILRTEMSS